MGDLIAAIMGFLVGLENSKPQIRCHTLAAIAASLLFFFRNIRRCLERLPQPPKRFHCRIDIKRTLYINFIYIKIF
ncbi:hypothetical protein [Achromobacter ruhlandii]|uniref:hypothetical protein n=1 Tax=Achromobacter ruhlandii TaxID=72557 RepID=UPI0015824BF7|nr:hypothetical protein [Achromobacter ruhlandii]